MRKYLIVGLILVAGLVSLTQPARQSITWLRTQDLTNTRYFIHQGDTIDFSAYGNVLDRVDADGDYLYFYSDTTLLDSAYINYTAEIDTFMYSPGGDSIILSLNNDGLYYLNISELTSKLDTVAIDSTLTGNGTIESPLGIEESILANAMKTNYTISLPSAGSVGNRILSATEGTDYPEGWVLTEVNGADLQITHNVGRRVAYVTVWSVSGTSHQMLLGNYAYSGLYSEENSLRIQGFATVNSDVVIQIVFAE